MGMSEAGLRPEPIEFGGTYMILSGYTLPRNCASEEGTEEGI